MDTDIARWILEFLIRQPLNERALNTLVRVLPLSDENLSLKKSLLLRRIDLEISNGSVSEKILEMLEQIEELDYREGMEVLETMKAAYCAVAVRCTVRFLEGKGDDKEGKYFEAVKRIWRGRVCEMERVETAGLISEELRSWKDEVEAAVWDVSVCENVVLRSKGNDAVEVVQGYVKEAKERMGPCFLEVVAETLSDDSVREVLGLGNNESVPSLSAEQDAIVSGSNKEMCKGNLLPRRKHVASRRPRGAISGTSRGVKIADTEELGVGTSSSKYGYLSTPEINKVQEALESSSLELQAVVKDPLPDALRLAETVRSSMPRENMDLEHATGNHNRVDVDAPSSSVDRSADAIQANEGDLGRHQNNGLKPSLMARNSTARSYEWNDSIEDLLDGSANDSSRLHLHSPKKRVVSPLKKYEITKLSRRRKIKKWSILEEDTLRVGVQKYGKGNWKLILNMYRDVFEERTEVDLKDKWRNMIRY